MLFMKGNSFQDALYIHFYDQKPPKLLEKIVLRKSKEGKFNMLDLGCGEGRVLFSLQKKGLLQKAKRIIGVDISEIRIRRLVRNMTDVKGIVSDACNVDILNSSSFDIIICSQLIEHIPDESRLLGEIRRLLKHDGYLYMSSVIKKPYGFWIYRRDGQFRLGIDHVREYPSSNYFLSLLEKTGFKILQVSLSQVQFRVLHFVISILVKANTIDPEKAQIFFLKNKLIAKLRNVLKFPVIGYLAIEVVALKE